MNRNQHKPDPEDLPSDDELEAMEDKNRTDIVDPEEFEKMREEIDKMAGRLRRGWRTIRKSLNLC